MQTPTGPDRTLVVFLYVFALVEFTSLMALVVYHLSRPG
jgi:hypothetical protein